MSNLQNAIEAFAQRVNANPHVLKLTEALQTQLHVEVLEAGECFRLPVVEGAITGVERVPAPQHETLLLRGRAAVLEAIFEGRMHPLAAFNQGELEVYGPQPDQIRLDAISLLIWGA
jgi:hypothetical protein